MSNEHASLPPSLHLSPPDEALAQLQAEFINYKRNVARMLEAKTSDTTTQHVLRLIPIFDAIDLMHTYDETLTDGMQVIVNALCSLKDTYSIVTYGVVGERFDPTKHEAVASFDVAEVEEAEILDVLAVGYQLGNKVLRPAKVAVAMPGDD